MINFILNKTLRAHAERYDYDVSYMQDILTNDLSAFTRFMGFQTMAAYSGNLPADAVFAARLRAILWEDCGPCTQLVVNMALEAGVSAEHIQAVIANDTKLLPQELALIVEFTDSVLAHNLYADELRAKIQAIWGQKGVVSLALAISSMRVYPTLKYTLGYGKSCSRITLNDMTLTPNISRV
ncbi:carboxymuconolactone decarboxylase family protein [Pseudoalteromonas sp. MMG022]|uniref:carboxymuconolactone decarboxylase family protein n=1 Tax=Pseudoalteromonas sp. MMG022 TaxID=2909978 RepID=UPI001F29AF12|nr:carboxymuconolactone decarboxylase family protein [Pseudoalteromonas sp. MMG022]MCF6437611.1 carboxymuconolactone decarboxylase family protein [Pseudoalteromonas sp. MMG022]